MHYTLITGASGGIGLEFAKIFAQNGSNLILVARTEEKLLQLKQQLQTHYAVSVEIIAMDLSKQDAAKELYAITKNAGYTVSCLINNAGLGDHCAFLDSDWNKQYEMMQLNLVCLTQMTYLYGNDMRREKYGYILNLSSVAAFAAGPYMSIYYAAKSFVLSFSLAVAEELRGTGVYISVFCPGPTTTGFEKAADMHHSNMFHLIKPASPKQVAEYGYRKMLQKKHIICHGWLTKLTVIGSRLISRQLTAKIAAVINGKECK